MGKTDGNFVIHAEFIIFTKMFKINRFKNFFVICTSGLLHLGSADSLTFDIPRTRTRMGDSALTVAGPRAWNALPADNRCAPSLDTFKKRLKSHLFSAAYEL